MFCDDLPDRLDAKTVFSFYDKDLPDVQGIQLYIKLSAEIESAIEDSAKKFDIVNPVNSTFFEGEDERRNYKFLNIGHTVFDGKTFLVQKAFSKDKHTQEETEDICFYIFDTNILATVSAENYVAEVRLKKRNDSFELKHRFVTQKYRGKGLGKMIFDTATSFLKAYSTYKQADTKCFAEVFQLDVLCPLWNRGYRPKDKTEEEKVAKVLRGGDGELFLGEDNLIFDRSVPETERIVANYQKAFHITLVKTFEPSIRSFDAESIVESTKTATQKV